MENTRVEHIIRANLNSWESEGLKLLAKSKGHSFREEVSEALAMWLYTHPDYEYFMCQIPPEVNEQRKRYNRELAKNRQQEQELRNQHHKSQSSYQPKAMSEDDMKPLNLDDIPF